ncbi:nucleotide sugar dehydrogenase [Micromonospora echinofusca]|uniref:nucleotide sugar dehydrogenase n=1 Tax=Micromonospora echinofusca TaxID=47858 RepID=UPI001AD688DF|nr:nucleotide sugar dehydrogenase [Micromonospora echinofusca]
MPTLAVVGLGYVGLPIAVEAHRAGFSVRGYDTSQAVVDGLRAGRSHVGDISDDDVAALLAAGFAPSTDETVLDGADVVTVCVATPLTVQGVPDLGDVRTAARTVGRHLSRGSLVVLESTTYPGTTDGVFAPIIADVSGLKPGVDFHVAFSPERIDTGNPAYNLRNTPKVVGGLTEACSVVATEFYRRLCDEVVVATSSREAEMSKLIENTYRFVNIALVNEFATAASALGVDLWNAIGCAASKPFGFQAFYPGPGLGGHCIPSDPVYLAYQSRSVGRPLQLVEMARTVNDGMPAHVVARARQILHEAGRTTEGASVLLAGVSYKRDSADVTITPAEPIARLLRAAGATVCYSDPQVPAWSVDGEPVAYEPDLGGAAGRADLTILLQDHSGFDLDALPSQARLLLDTRGRLRHAHVPTLW